MRIRSVTIKDYKAIKEVTLRLDKPLIPIVGINEAGKSTILEAILAFMSDNDELNNGNHLDPTNIYTGTREAQISAEIMLESITEITSLQSPDRDNARRDMFNNIKSNLRLMWKNEKRIFVITRHLPTLEYSFVSPLASQHREEGRYEDTYFIRQILERLPKFVYREDFNDRIPNKISYIRTASENSLEFRSDQNNSLWLSIIREVFSRSDVNFHDYIAHVERETYPDSDPEHLQLRTHLEQLKLVNRQLNRQLAEEWLQLSGEKEDHTSETIPYTVELEHASSRIIPSENGKVVEFSHEFRFRIEDRRSQKQTGAFYVTQRSKGYQWFINFVLQVIYNPDYRNTRDQALFLLDEPGSYLHPLAQDRLLDKLVEISKSTRIIYTTHFPQLVNPAKIRLHDCLVAYREGNRVELDSYGNMRESQSIGALTTLHNAMKINLPGIMFPNSPIPFVITEGITEFYVFSMVKKYTSLFEGCEFSLVPGAGVDQLKDLISLAIAWSDQYVVIFDKDDQATKAINRYGELFGDEQRENYWIQIDNSRQDKRVTLEGLFSETDRDQLLDVTQVQDMKRAFELLHFSDPDEQQAYWKGIDQETSDNFALVANKIRDVLGSAAADEASPT